MRKRVLLAVLATAMVAFAPAPFLVKKKPGPRAGDLVGLWEVVERSTSAIKGKKAAPTRLLIEIAPGKWSFQTMRGEALGKATPYDLRLGEADGVGTFDLDRPGMGRTPWGMGIYRFEGEDLRIAYTFRTERPKDFDAPPGRGATRVVVMRLRRVKK